MTSKTARRPPALPTIAPCPRPGCKRKHYLIPYMGGGNFVLCTCGWTGPIRKTERAAILAWNPRSDAEAEDVDMLRSLERDVREMLAASKVCEVVAWKARLELAICELDVKRGEVLPATKTKARKRT